MLKDPARVRRRGFAPSMSTRANSLARPCCATYAIRVPKAYPIYDADYAARVQVIRGWLEGVANLQQVGRNGLHRYNNSDHSMLTAMRAVENAVEGADHDIWAVNAESVYHETHVEDEHPYRTAPETPEMKALAARSSSD